MAQSLNKYVLLQVCALIVALFVTAFGSLTMAQNADFYPPVDNPQSSDFHQAYMRQIQEGYWLSEIIDTRDVAFIHKKGVRAVISLVRTDEETSALLAANGIEQINAYMGNTFRPKHIAAVDYALKNYTPDEILIHCTHGADRTGAVAVYLLALNHSWSIEDAFFSVVSPDKKNIAELKKVLRETVGLSAEGEHRSRGDGFTGNYATFGPKGFGGHKVTGNYGILTRSTIEVLSSL